MNSPLKLLTVLFVLLLLFPNRIVLLFPPLKTFKDDVGLLAPVLKCSPFKLPIVEEKNLGERIRFDLGLEIKKLLVMLEDERFIEDIFVN